LPPFLSDVVLRGLRLGDSSVDLLVHRHEQSVSVEVIDSRGAVHVSIEYAAQPAERGTRTPRLKGRWS